MPALMIDESIEAQAKQVMAYAIDHVWHADYETAAAKPPGDNPNHCLLLSGHYRVVFSYTEFKGKMLRDISVSVPQKYPHPIAMYTIAELFGFTGWDQRSAEPPADWIIHVDESARVVRVVQMLN